MVMDHKEWVKQLGHLVILFAGNAVNQREELKENEFGAVMDQDIRNFLTWIFEKKPRYAILNIPPEVKKEEVADSLVGYKNMWRRYKEIKAELVNKVIPKLKARKSPKSGENWDDVLNKVRQDCFEEHCIESWKTSKAQNKPAVYVPRPFKDAWYPHAWLAFYYYGPHTEEPLACINESINSSNQPKTAAEVQASIEDQRKLIAEIGSRAQRRAMGLSSRQFDTSGNEADSDSEDFDESSWKVPSVSATPVPSSTAKKSTKKRSFEASSASSVASFSSSHPAPDFDKAINTLVEMKEFQHFESKKANLKDKIDLAGQVGDEARVLKYRTELLDLIDSWDNRQVNNS